MINPLPLSVYNGKVKEMKAQKEKRAKLEQENNLGKSLGFKISKEDKNDCNFYKAFKSLKNLYKKYNFKFVTDADSVLITQYCDLVSEIEMLREKKRTATTVKELAEINKILNKDRELLVKIARELYLTPTTRVRTQAQIIRDQKANKDEEIAKEVFE